MAEENTNAVETVETMETDYLSEIQKLKESTVDKTTYNKLLEENRKLLNTVVQGQQIEMDEPAPEPVDLDALRNDLFNNKNISNLEYAEKALILRKALIEQGQRDPFLPVGDKYQSTGNEEATANKVAEVLAHCVEYADGDSSVFTNELARLTKDSMPMTPSRRR